ncbi:MAG TPA: preprotein translocase subunit YajC [Gemmatimonadales bacterium]|nr:preprotein translocase subunit YajC [Gemmatimonadales bacterium]
MTASLLAMTAADTPGGGLSLLLFQIVAIGLVFYFLILRPQSQARKKHEEVLKNIKKGDEVTTAGGIIGKVKDVKEDRVTIESGTATLVIERTRIIRVGDSAPAPGAAG